MYFGYERMWTLTFIPVGFVVVMVGGLAFVGAYVVGALGGGRAAVRYTWGCTLVTVLACAGVLAYGVASGQWALFMDWYGPVPFIEMALLAFMWVASMGMMALSYSYGREHADRRAASGESGEGQAVRTFGGVSEREERSDA